MRCGTSGNLRQSTWRYPAAQARSSMLTVMRARRLVSIAGFRRLPRAREGLNSDSSTRAGTYSDQMTAGP